MKLSVLLPTRNGARFLPTCVDAILDQPGDLELVVSDNANDDGTTEFLASRSDPRLVVVRHETPLSVTDNWTSALEASTGDYILVLGDDDLLLPGSAERILGLAAEADWPDCLLYNAYSYVSPGAMTGINTSQYADPHFHYGPEFIPYQELSMSFRHDLVVDMFRFRPRLPLNMQTTVFSRAATSRIRGAVFPPPFPDHYALNSLLLTADRWFYAPERLIVIGVTPKSFGHYMYSDKRTEGLDYLGIAVDFPGRVPGNALIDAMHIWLQMLLEAYPDKLSTTSISHGDYVLRQIWSWLVGWRNGAMSLGEVRRLAFRLRAADVAPAATALLRQRDLWTKAARRLRPRRGASEAQWQGLRPIPDIDEIGAFGRWISRCS